ncbi:hypothetical protein QBC42DRAFT_279896 [Cladorrhinum samala]|uniref:Uncharacterized protein n=1 Tax=Cladorrhinum samala TaxID=585594 RepID=A0AAV9H961_9PEZI|nr:hypothetical protein QBC42DRAFT_279896 [Cladorrhinum samala]
MIIFQDTTSIIEVLWDIALAFFVVRLAAIYALLTYTTVLLVSLLPISISTPSSSSGPHVPLAIKLIASSALWARYVIVRYEIPRAVWFRAAIGVVAALLGVVGEVVLRLFGLGGSCGMTMGIGEAVVGFGGVAGIMVLMGVLEKEERKWETIEEGEKSL